MVPSVVPPLYCQDDESLADVDFLAAKVAMAEDGSVVIAGETLDDWAAPNAGSSDFVAAK